MEVSLRRARSRAVDDSAAKPRDEPSRGVDRFSFSPCALIDFQVCSNWVRAKRQPSFFSFFSDSSRNRLPPPHYLPAGEKRKFDNATLFSGFHNSSLHDHNIDSAGDRPSAKMVQPRVVFSSMNEVEKDFLQY